MAVFRALLSRGHFFPLVVFSRVTHDGQSERGSEAYYQGQTTYDHC